MAVSNVRYQRSYDYHVKVLIMGDSNVGKSAIALQFSESRFEPSTLASVGVDFCTKVVNVDDANVKVNVWDISGGERFKTITMGLYRNVMGALLVYDVTDFLSFENIEYWLKNLEANASEEIVLVLVGNKTDREIERVISYDKGSTLANKFGCSFFETSALTGSNIMQALKSITKQCKNKLEVGFDFEKISVGQESCSPNKCWK